MTKWQKTDTLLISEVFYSLQGESTWAGLPCFFIRLAGCNLRCSYCDASFTWQEAGQEMPVESVLAQVMAADYPLVEVTGGEPLLQEGVYSLFGALKAQAKTILLETNGSIALDRVPPEVNIIMDVKCPSSGTSAQFHAHNLAILQKRQGMGSTDEVKFVLSSPADFHWARNFIAQQAMPKGLPILFSPVQPAFPAEQLAALMLTHRVQVRLQLQLHKILWPNLDRGV